MQMYPDLSLDEIQGNISPGFRKDFQELIFVRFPDGAAGRHWLGALYDDLTSGWEVATYNRLYYRLKHPPKLKGASQAWPLPQRRERTTEEVVQILRSTWVNVALTAKGLDVLGADLTGFPEAFTDGLVRRTTGTNPSFVFGRKDDWKVRDSLQQSDGAAAQDGLTHAVLILGADTEADLTCVLYEQYRRLAEFRIDLVVSHRGQTLGDGREHFGFRDGISQPDPNDPIAGWVKRNGKLAKEQFAPPGEFILGYTNDSGAPPTEHEWARHGSYLVFLRLQQDVATFRREMHDGANHLAPSIGNEMNAELLAAKVVGRWPSGAKLRPGKLRDPSPGKKPREADLQIWTSDFTSDRPGDGCPLFSHIRKVHPRGEREGSGPLPTNRRRLIRRGIPYGPPLAEGMTNHDTVERGMLFLAYQANIEQQFEHIMKSWVNSDIFPQRPGLFVGWDGLLGFDNTRPANQELGVLYHRDGQGEAYADFVTVFMERFIHARDGGYFFAPSIPAVAALANQQFHP